MSRCTQLKKTLDRVEIYQNTVIAIPFLWGMRAALFGIETPIYVSAVMSPAVYAVWVGMHVFGPILVWAGQTFKPPRVKWPLQFGGHFLLFTMSTIYTIAVMSQELNTEDAIYQLLFVVGFGLCTIELITRDILEIMDSEGGCTQRE